jgi:hypothetical protein
MTEKTPEPLPCRLPLDKNNAALPFVWQRDEYSCGPACLATIGKLYGAEAASYDTLRAILEPNQTVGSCNFKMAAVSRDFFPVAGDGENTYHGGVAVANIMQEGEGHYVVFLCREGEKVIYYDPYHHELVIDRLDDLEWISESKHLTRWSVNYAPHELRSIAAWRALGGV